MKKVCHMSSAHRGLDIRIFHKECVTLSKAGYDTHLVICATDEEVKHASVCGVQLHPLPIPSNRFARMVKQSWLCYRLASKLKADIYHFHDPELIPYGILLKLSGSKVIYDVHEDVPRSILSKFWIPAWLRKLVSIFTELIENSVSRYFFSIIAATPHIANRFQAVNPATIDVNNYALPNELSPLPGLPLRKQQICYVGAISRVRGIRPLIDALPLVPHIKLILCGSFAEPELQNELEALPGWKQVVYLGYVNRDTVRNVLSECIAGIITLMPSPAYFNSLPIKMFEYMSAELPVIASDFPLWIPMVVESGAGFCVDPTDSVAIADAISRLSRDSELVNSMGQSGRETVLACYSWTTEAYKLLAFYKGLQ